MKRSIFKNILAIFGVLGLSAILLGAADNLSELSSDGNSYQGVTFSGGGAISGTSATMDTITSDSMSIGGASVLDTNKLHTSADFPNNTTLYGWHLNETSDDATRLNWIGTKDLTRNGTTLTSTNHLGSTAFCNFNGTSDYLNSTDSIFDTTGSFIMGAWIRPDSLTGAQTIIAKYNTGADRSFLFYLNGDNLNFDIFIASSNSKSAVSGDIAFLDDGNFHHVAIIYDQTKKGLTLMLDGNIVASKYDSGMGSRWNTTNMDFTVGATGAGTNFFSGDITEVFYKDISDDTLNWVNAIRKIYAVGSRKLVTQDGNDKVAILDGRQYNGYYQVNIIASVSLTLSMDALTSYELYIPESGLYEVGYSIHPHAIDATSTNVRSIVYGVLKGGSGATTEIIGCAWEFYWASTSSSSITPDVITKQTAKSLQYHTVGDVIRLFGRRDNNTETGDLFYSVGRREPYMYYKKLD